MTLFEAGGAAVSPRLYMSAWHLMRRWSFFIAIFMHCLFLSEYSDRTGVEARVLAWLAGEDWVLEEFRGAGKIYEATASRMYHVPKESIVKSYCRRNAMGTPMTGVDAAPSGLCKQCGALISGRRDKRGKQFCSDRCRYQWWHLHRGESINATDHTCLFCGRVFRTNRQQKYCCHNCYIMARFGGRTRYEADKRTV